MDQKLTDLVELDVDDVTKLYLIDDMLKQAQARHSSDELRSLFWITILSLSVRLCPCPLSSLHCIQCLLFSPVTFTLLLSDVLEFSPIRTTADMFLFCIFPIARVLLVVDCYSSLRGR